MSKSEPGYDGVAGPREQVWDTGTTQHRPCTLVLSFQSSFQPFRRQIRSHREADLRSNSLYTYGSDVIGPPYGFNQRLASRQELGQAPHEGITRASRIHGINSISRHVRDLILCHQ